MISLGFCKLFISFYQLTIFVHGCSISFYVCSISLYKFQGIKIFFAGSEPRFGETYFNRMLGLCVFFLYVSMLILYDLVLEYSMFYMIFYVCLIYVCFLCLL